MIQPSQDVNSFNESKTSQGHQLLQGEQSGSEQSLADQWHQWPLVSPINNSHVRCFSMYLFDFNKLVKRYVGGDEHESLGTVRISITSASLTLMLNNSTCKLNNGVHWGRQAGIWDLRILFQGKKKKRDITLKSPRLASLLRYQHTGWTLSHLLKMAKCIKLKRHVGWKSEHSQYCRLKYSFASKKKKKR